MDPALAITGARIEVRMPSLAPNYREEFDLDLDGATIDDWDARVSELLEKTRVNDLVTLGEHIVMQRTGDVSGLEYVAAGAPERVFAVGGTQSTLVLTLEGGATYHFDAYMDYSGPHVGALRALVGERGTRLDHGLFGLEALRAPMPIDTEE